MFLVYYTVHFTKTNTHHTTLVNCVKLFKTRNAQTKLFTCRINDTQTTNVDIYYIQIECIKTS